MNGREVEANAETAASSPSELVSALQHHKPGIVAWPKRGEQCRNLERQWSQYLSALVQTHNACHQQQQGQKSSQPQKLRQTTRDCSYPACEDLHQLAWGPVRRKLGTEYVTATKACFEAVAKYERHQKQVEQYIRQKEAQYQQAMENWREKWQPYQMESAEQKMLREAEGQRLAADLTRDRTLDGLNMAAMEQDLLAKQYELAQLDPGADPHPMLKALVEKARQVAQETALSKMLETALAKTGLDQLLVEPARQSLSALLPPKVLGILARQGWKVGMGLNVGLNVLEPEQIGGNEVNVWLDSMPEAHAELQARVARLKVDRQQTRETFQTISTALESLVPREISLPALGRDCAISGSCLQADPSPNTSTSSTPDVTVPERYWSREEALAWVLPNRVSGIRTPFEDPQTGEAGIITKLRPPYQNQAGQQCSTFEIRLLTKTDSPDRQYTEERCQ